MFGLGTQELLIILVLVMIVFGAGKLPQVGKSLGQGLRNFKKGVMRPMTILKRVKLKKFPKKMGTKRRTLKFVSDKLE
jgi:sec-independent protein translocase protein TatA